MKITKKYVDLSLLYAVLAMVGGVFYREFTKFVGFSGKTVLSVVHTHYFVLGCGMFLVLLLLEKSFQVSEGKLGKLLAFYQVGLNLTVLLFLVRGVLQALETPLASGPSAAISGVAGIGHIILGVSLVLVLVQVRKAVLARG